MIEFKLRKATSHCLGVQNQKREVISLWSYGQRFVVMHTNILLRHLP